MRALRKALSPDEREEQSREISRHVCATQAYKDARAMLVYSAYGSEADPAPLARFAEKEGKRVAYPACIAGRLQAFIPGAWRVGAHGIMEPLPERSELVPPDALDLVVVPALAFDRQGNRLGQGAGYYDAFLPLANCAVWMGFALDLQLIDAVEHDARDVRLHAIATPHGVICTA